MSPRRMSSTIWRRSPTHRSGVVFASQVIEHLPYPRLLRFLGAARAKLRPAGLLIVETPNPHYPLALRNFWIDPTHQHPLFPEVVLALCRLSGFTGGYIWHPGGIGDPDQDRTAQPDYAIVAEVTAPAAASPVPGAVSVVTDVGELWYPERCQVLTPAVRQSGTWDAPDGAAIRAALAPGMTVVDVGAHVGYFALLAAQCVGPGGKVVAVEPAPENYAMLAANVARAGATQVEPVHGAAWREAGELELRLSPTNTGDHRVYDTGPNRTGTLVRAVALDDVIADCDRLDLVIVDTQGAERAGVGGNVSGRSRAGDLASSSSSGRRRSASSATTRRRRSRSTGGWPTTSRSSMTRTRSTVAMTSRGWSRSRRADPAASARCCSRRGETDDDVPSRGARYHPAGRRSQGARSASRHVALATLKPSVPHA